MIAQKESSLERTSNKTIERTENTTIERTQKLPPYKPTADTKRSVIRPKSNCTNWVSTTQSSKRPSKLRISLRGSLNSEEKPKLRTKSAFGIFDSISKATLSEKTKSILMGKRVVSKDLRRKSKSRLSMNDK